MEEIEGYTIKTVNSDSDLTEKEIEEKVDYCDILIPLHGTTKMKDIKAFIQAMDEGETFQIIYIHRYIQDNITTFGVKMKGGAKIE
jgi:hypothetical protein